MAALALILAFVVFVLILFGVTLFGLSQAAMFALGLALVVLGLLLPAVAANLGRGGS